MSPLRRIPRLAPVTCALLVAALALATCGDDEGGGSSQTATTATKTATTPASDFDGAIWPDPADATEAATPVDVARSFVEDFLGMENPAFGEFQEGDARSGEVPMLLVGEDGKPRADRVLASIAVRQLGGARWFVIAAGSDQVEISSPDVFEAISSPVTVTGNGFGFESNLTVSVRAAFEPEPLAEEGTAAGDRAPRPFSQALTFERPATATGSIIVRDGGGADGVPYAFAAVAIRFAEG
jgi:hypothetical protein